jgi:hypothetical protein
MTDAAGWGWRDGASNNALDRTAGSPSLAPAGQRERWADQGLHEW